MKAVIGRSIWLSSTAGKVWPGFRRGIPQHLHVEIEADGFHLALCSPQADLPTPRISIVAHRQLVPLPQLGEFPGWPQLLPGGSLKGRNRRGRRARRGLARPAAHPPHAVEYNCARPNLVGNLPPGSCSPGEKYPEPALDDRGAGHQHRLHRPLRPTMALSSSPFRHLWPWPPAASGPAASGAAFSPPPRSPPPAVQRRTPGRRGPSSWRMALAYRLVVTGSEVGPLIGRRSGGRRGDQAQFRGTRRGSC